MKSSLLFATSCGLLTAAAPAAISRRAFNTIDTMEEMDNAIEGIQRCQEVAVIFARGTFDQGNVGVWVGNIFAEALVDELGRVGIQGVDPVAYPADLGGYLRDGGSNTGAQALADTVTKYNAVCPDSTIIVSGWSQGALVAHKGLDLVKGPALAKVAALATFGDPWQYFGNTPVPKGVTLLSECFNTGIAVDPLCAPAPTTFKLPKTAAAVVAGLAKLPSTAKSVDQVAAAAKLVAAFPGQLVKSFDAFLASANEQDFVKLLLTPQHFRYGNDGNAANLAKKIAALPAVQKALAK